MELTSFSPGSRIQEGAWSAAEHSAHGPSVAAHGASAPFRFLPAPGDVILRMTKQVALVRRRLAAGDAGFAQVAEPQSCVLIGFHRTTLRIVVDAHTGVVGPNHMSLHAPGSTWAREAVEAQGEASDCIALSPALLRRIRAAHGLGENVSDAALFAHPFAPCTPAAFLAQRRLFAATRERLQLDSQAIEAAVWKIAGEALRGAQRQADARQSMGRLDRAHSLVEAAKMLIARGFMAELPLNEIALRLHCSRGHLSRTFHALTGYKPIEYRNELRLRHGLALMEEFGSSSETIAAKLSFVNRSHFSRTVQKRLGMTPTEYIRNLSGDAPGPADRAYGAPVGTSLDTRREKAKHGYRAAGGPQRRRAPSVAASLSSATSER